jgi:hypothetical protein
MYNTQFKVKYNDIEQELINKLKEEQDDNDYCTQDVLDICNKLYRDELLSVFGLDDLDDDKLNQSMNYVYDTMIKNEQFKQLVVDMEEKYFKEFITNQEKQDSIRQVILISLFSQHIFHIIHKCICQQIETGTIDDILIADVRHNLIDLLENQFKFDSPL